MPAITINGTSLHIPDGNTVLEAALQAGIFIPTLCYHPKITPSDSCRLCLVEIEGMPRPVTACNTLAVDGMRVTTDTPQVQAMREEVIKLILMDHPLDCPVCPAAGECDLQELTHRMGIGEIGFPVLHRNAARTDHWPLIQYDPNLCIACQRCVKVCHEVIGASALTLRGSGYRARIDTITGQPLNCDFCGECVQVCPVGALSVKTSGRVARPWELEVIPTICPLCSAGCRIAGHVRDGRVFRTMTPPESISNASMCVGGRFAYDFVQSEDRLTDPLLRKNGVLVPVSWDEALSTVAGAITAITSVHGADAIAGIGSPRLTNEDAYAFQKLFRSAIGTNNIDSEARFSFLRVERAFELTCGRGNAFLSLDRLLETEAVLVIGCDPLEETPALGWKIKTATRRYDCNLVVANARETSLAPFARVRLRCRPYSETHVALGLMKIILEEDLWDRDFVREKAGHFLPLKNLLDKLSLAGILRRTGLTRTDLEEAARLLGRASTAAIIFGGDVILQADGLQCAMNLINLALLTGNIGELPGGVYPVFEKGNMVGVCDMGLMPEYLPGRQTPASARDLFESAYGAPLPYGRGFTLSEMVRAMETGGIKAMLVAGADPVSDFPAANRFRQAFAQAELLVAVDIFLSPTAAMAHCVLPGASFAEKQGSMTNIKRRVQKLNRLIPPCGQAMAEWRILNELGRALGTDLGYRSSEDVFGEMQRTIPFLSGIDLSDTEGEGVVIRSAADSFRSEPRGKPFAFAPTRPVEKPDSEFATDYPFELMAGRSKYHFGSTTSRSRHITVLCPHHYVEINGADATDLGITEGDEVQVSSPSGTFSAPARITSALPRGMVFGPVNFPEMGIYNLFQENTTLCRVRLESPGGRRPS